MTTYTKREVTEILWRAAILGFAVGLLTGVFVERLWGS